MVSQPARGAGRPAILLLGLVAAGLLAGGVYFRLRPRHPPTPGAGSAPPALAPGETRGAADPVFIVVVARHPGASAEEVERQVTIPLEVAVATAPGLKVTRSQSRFGLAHLRLVFEGTDYYAARQEVINRLQFVAGLPAGVVPLLSPESPAGDLYRYTLEGPRDGQGRDVYTPGDLRALQDWVLEREFRRLPGVLDVLGRGGTVKRYEVHPDPERLRRYGIPLGQLEKALAEGNGNVGGDLVQGRVALGVRSIGLFGGGQDPVQQAVGLKDPRAAAARLRAEEDRRLREIRRLVIARVQGVPVRVEDVVEGGRGVVVGHEPRTGRVGVRRAGGPDEDDAVQGVVLLRPGEDPREVLRRVRARVRELNDTPDTLLPGVRIQPYYERAGEGSARDGALWVHAAFPADASLEAVADRMRAARALLLRNPEVGQVVTQVGGPEDGTDPAGPDSVRATILLRPDKDRPRTRAELAEGLEAQLRRTLTGVDWEVTAVEPKAFPDPFVAGPGEGLLKIFAPDLDALEKLAGRAKEGLAGVEGVAGVRVLPGRGRANLEFRVDPDKCARWGVSTADVNNLIQTALEGKRVTQVVEGEKTFGVVLRLPERFRRGEAAILDLPVDVMNNQVAPPAGPGVAPPGRGVAPPRKADGGNPITATPRLRLRDLVSPVGADGQPDPKGRFLRAGVAAVYREEGRRLVVLRFRMRGRDPAAAVAEARKKLAPLFKAPYRAEWTSGS